MANNYTDILALVNAGNQMGLSNTIKRDYGIPLDFTSVQASYDEAVKYAATSTLAYVGQTVAVGAKLYIVSDVSVGKHTVGDTEYDVYLAEVGSATEGDGNTIELDGKVLKLAGLTGLDNSKTYVPSLINGKLVWAEPDTSTAEGQAQEINALKTRAAALEATVNGVEAAEGVEAQEGLVDKVAANAQAIADETAAREAAIGAPATDEAEASGVYASIAEALQAAKDYADAQDDNTIYDDTELVNRVSAAEEKIIDLEDILGSDAEGLVKDVADNTKAIEDLDAAYKTADETTLTSAKTYTDEEIAGLSVTIETRENIEYIIVKNKSGQEVSAVDASKFAQDSFLDDVSYSPETGKVTFTWKMGDGSTKSDEIDIKHLVDVYTNGFGLTLNNNEFAVDSSVIATVEELNKVKETAEAAQTAEEVEAAIDAKIAAENLSQYATTTGVAETLKSYYTKSDIDSKGYAVATEVSETYATKQSLTDLSNTLDATLANYLTEAAAETTYAKIGDAYTKAETDAKIGVPGTPAIKDEEGNVTTDAVAGTGVYQHVYSKDEVTALIADITGGESAADVLAALNAYKTTNDTRVKAVEDTNATQDTAIQTAKETADRGVADAKTANDAIAALTDGFVADTTQDITTIKGRLDTLETAKGAHEQRLTTAEGNITALLAADETINSTLGTIQGNITALNNEDSRLAGLISATDAKFASYYTKSEVDTEVQKAIDAIPDVDLDPYAKTADVTAALALKADASVVYTKEEANAEFLNQDEVDARINALIVAADPEGGKTITDIQNLVKYVDENASEIAALITATGANTDKLAGIDTTVVAAINAAVASVVTPKASDEVTVAEDGTLGLGEVSTDKLVMGSDTLVLDGGSAL